MTDLELGEVLGQFYPPEPPLVPNMDTSTMEGMRWRAHMLDKPRQEWYDRQSNSNRDPWFDNR